MISAGDLRPFCSILFILHMRKRDLGVSNSKPSWQSSILCPAILWLSNIFLLFLWLFFYYGSFGCCCHFWWKLFFSGFLRLRVVQLATGARLIHVAYSAQITVKLLLFSNICAPLRTSSRISYLATLYIWNNQK